MLTAQEYYRTCPANVTLRDSCSLSDLITFILIAFTPPGVLHQLVVSRRRLFEVVGRG